MMSPKLALLRHSADMASDFLGSCQIVSKSTWYHRVACSDCHNLGPNEEVNDLKEENYDYPDCVDWIRLNECVLH